MTGSQDTSTGTTSTYEPSVADVLVVKCMLTKSLNLPPEIIDTIADLAEYWPHTTTEALFNGSCEARGNHIRGQAGIENKFLVSFPGHILLYPSPAKCDGLFLVSSFVLPHSVSVQTTGTSPPPTQNLRSTGGL